MLQKMLNPADFLKGIFPGGVILITTFLSTKKKKALTMGNKWGQSICYNTVLIVKPQDFLTIWVLIWF